MTTSPEEGTSRTDCTCIHIHIRYNMYILHIARQPCLDPVSVCNPITYICNYIIVYVQNRQLRLKGERPVPRQIAVGCCDGRFLYESLCHHVWHRRATYHSSRQQTLEHESLSDMHGGSYTSNHIVGIFFNKLNNHLSIVHVVPVCMDAYNFIQLCIYVCQCCMCVRMDASSLHTRCMSITYLSHLCFASPIQLAGYIYQYHPVWQHQRQWQQ